MLLNRNALGDSLTRRNPVDQSLWARGAGLCILDERISWAGLAVGTSWGRDLYNLAIQSEKDHIPLAMPEPDLFLMCLGLYLSWSAGSAEWVDHQSMEGSSWASLAIAREIVVDLSWDARVLASDSCDFVWSSLGQIDGGDDLYITRSQNKSV